MTNIFRRVFFLLIFFPLIGYGGNANESIHRMDIDVKKGLPLIAHIVVALCDNESQGIVPVSQSLGNGNSPRTNLYWGALYGVKTFFSNSKNWHRIKTEQPKKPYILERVIFTRKLMRNEIETRVYLIADAWQGNKIENATEYFLELSSGKHEEDISITMNNTPIELKAGGSSHVLAYIGHNGLMDFSIAEISMPSQNSPFHSSIVLACFSESYFANKLSKAGTHSLLTTNGLMAPEAYTLEAAITSWFSGKSTTDTHLSASLAYSKYQKAKLSWSKKLFSTTK